MSFRHARPVSELEELGLTELEERVYLATLDRAKSTVEEVSVACSASRYAARSALDNLQELGLATRLAGSPAHYSPVRPDLAIGVLLRQREERLAHARVTLARLTERYERATRGHHPDELLELVHSPEAIHQRWLQLQRSAVTEVRVLDKPPYIDAGNPAEPGLLDTGVRYRTVYDRTAFEYPGKLAGVWEAAAAGENCRIAHDVPIKLFLADDRMALAPLRPGDDLAGAVIVHPSSLLDALGALFEGVWQQALPLAAFQDGHVADGIGLDEQQLRLLQLLASGCTDETTARYLDVGLRTVQRHIRVLMEQFNVRTRFQLGLRAATIIAEAERVNGAGGDRLLFTG